MIENEKELLVSLEYAQKWLSWLEGIRITAETKPATQTPEMIALHMNGPLMELNRVLADAVNYVEGRIEPQLPAEKAA
jgi:hypothetical protein